MDYGDGGTQAYSFDDMGNRLTKNDSVSGNESYSYNAANMLLTRGTNSYSNDPDGNTLTGGGRTNTWDSQNRLVSCLYGSNTSSYVYGSDGFRHQSTVNGTTTDFALDGRFFVQELRGGTQYATYLTGPTGPLYRRDATGATLRWYVYDGLGSVLGEVDASGNLDATRTYDVYGLARSVTGTPTSKHGWVWQLGHTSEDETGLVYMRARYMDPVVGRFIGQDPDHQHGNWFAYAGDNPVSRADTTGKDDWQILGTLLFAIGSGFIIGGQALSGASATAFYTSVFATMAWMSAFGDLPFPVGPACAILALAISTPGIVAAGSGVISGVMFVLTGAFIAEAGLVLMALGADGVDEAEGLLDSARSCAGTQVPELPSILNH